jgi:hypothetical protein
MALDKFQSRIPPLPTFKVERLGGDISLDRGSTQSKIWTMRMMLFKMRMKI